MLSILSLKAVYSALNQAQLSSDLIKLKLEEGMKRTGESHMNAQKRGEYFFLQ